MQHQIKGLDNLPPRKQIEVLASLLKDKIKEVNKRYWENNDPYIRVFFYHNREASYGLYTGPVDSDRRINLLMDIIKTEN